MAELDPLDAGRQPQVISCAVPSQREIFKPPALVNPSVYPKPIPFGGMGESVNQNGFSEHFPITMTVTEVD
jgi:hypothetical protein